MTLVYRKRAWLMGLLLVLFVGGVCCAAANRPRPKRKPLIIPEVAAKDRICFAPYTVQNKVLKMTAQLYPLKDGESRDVKLCIRKQGKWVTVARTKVRENDYDNYKHDKSWCAHLRVENWDHSRDWSYRVVALDGVATYEGRIRKDPVDKEEIVVAGFTGNSNGDRRDKPDLIANIKAQNPDLLFFSGDQSYDHKDHLYAWLLFGRQYGEIIKDRPTVCIPDDHDIGQGNMWGQGGRKSYTPAGHDGGYFYSPDYVKEVEFAQTSYLPDPYDPTPVLQGIGVYYTNLKIGKVDFAILEDRKFKTGPKGVVPQQGPRPDHVNDPSYDPKTVDVAGAELLGQRQLTFLKDWGQQWQGVNMKSVLSQTIFCGGAHIHSGRRLFADLDSNGWPQTGRNRAVDAMRRAFAFHLAGDQHLPTVIHHGIDDFRDSGFSFSVPSIVNYYPRKWWPLEKPFARVEGPLEHTGDYFDGFRNHVTMHAYANLEKYPAPKDNLKVSASGHGLVRFNTKTRKITLECWPRQQDVTQADAEQYIGWPVVIDQLDNYGRQAKAWLPTLQISGMTDPVVQVINDATDEIEYTLRIKGNEFDPKVFAKGQYTIKVGEPGTARLKVLTRIKAAKKQGSKVLKIKL
jgi:hypothetical protein